MNDFESDLGVLQDPINAREYLSKLATVYLKGRERRSRIVEILNLNDVEAVCFARKQYYEINGEPYDA